MLQRIRNISTFRCSSIAAPTQEGFDLVVIAEERHKKLGSSVLKDKSEIAVTAAFEELAS
jgi:hypothetical protein